MMCTSASPDALRWELIPSSIIDLLKVHLTTHRNPSSSTSYTSIRILIFVFIVLTIFGGSDGVSSSSGEYRRRSSSSQSHHAIRMKITEEEAAYRTKLPYAAAIESRRYFDNDAERASWLSNNNSLAMSWHTPRRFTVTETNPIHILFPLPTEQGPQELNPFGITIALTRPVVDEALEEVYRRKLVPTNALFIHFEDSKLSDAHGPNVAITHLVNNRLDCIIGKFLNARHTLAFRHH